jgi:hypothetical protein
MSAVALSRHLTVDSIDDIAATVRSAADRVSLRLAG